MKIQVVSSFPSNRDIVYLATKADTRPPGVTELEFSGKRNTVVVWRRDKTGRALSVGVGEAKKITPEVIRQAVGTAVRHLLKIGGEKIVIAGGAYAGQTRYVVEGALLAAYKFEAFKEKSERRPHQLAELILVVPKTSLAAAKAQALTGQIIAEATNQVRALGNSPGNVINPAALAHEAKKIATQHKLRVKIWDEKQLQKEKFGGILAVGQGSANPPRLIALEYHGGKKGQAPIVLVGKAITFDSGGISIKPSDRMDEMKFDKMGGCAVLGAMQAIARLKWPLNIVGLVASAENLPSATAYRPGDLVTTYDGKTIEVLNTDAEGRIVLADALAYARLHYRPKFIVDFATLTGACVVALGGRRAGLFTADKVWRERLEAAGEATGDLVWSLPVGDEYTEQIRSDIATAKNTGGREGGASTAASFLQLWVEQTPWAHVDLAGPAWTTKELPYLEKGATGFGVRLILEALSQL